jgi:hypothetical protein
MEFSRVDNLESEKIKLRMKWDLGTAVLTKSYRNSELEHKLDLFSFS